MVERIARCANCGRLEDGPDLKPCDNAKIEPAFIIAGDDVRVLKASNFFDLLKAYDGTLASLGAKPIPRSDSRTPLGVPRS